VLRSDWLSVAELATPRCGAAEEWAPKLPGFFIVAAVFTAAEKASGAILEDARG
jgi:hypothetical protein